jgi:hypothetical protein
MMVYSVKHPWVLSHDGVCGVHHAAAAALVNINEGL